MLNTSYMPKGTDVSFYQDDNETPQMIDFVAMFRQIMFTIIRAGQSTWVDPDITYNWSAAKKAGMIRGSYWFYDSRTDPKIQAKLWIETLEGDLGEMPLWCDYEDHYGGNYGRWQDWYDFMEYLKGFAPGKELGIYTNYYYWTERTSFAPLASLNYFKQYPLWVARYKATEPLIPKPWKTWMLWQYTDKEDGPLHGVESKNVDMNYFNGTESDLLEMFGTPSTDDTWKINKRLLPFWKTLMKIYNVTENTTT